MLDSGKVIPMSLAVGQVLLITDSLSFNLRRRNVIYLKFFVWRQRLCLVRLAKWCRHCILDWTNRARNPLHWNTGPALKVYTVPNSRALASNMQNTSSPKYNDDISLLKYHRCAQGSGGYLASEKVGGSYYPQHYGCYYTNMDYLPTMGHSSLNVPVSNFPYFNIVFLIMSLCSSYPSPFHYQYPLMSSYPYICLKTYCSSHAYVKYSSVIILPFYLRIPCGIVSICSVVTLTVKQSQLYILHHGYTRGAALN
jgi:hypothetical protein